MPINIKVKELKIPIIIFIGLILWLVVFPIVLMHEESSKENWEMKNLDNLTPLERAERLQNISKPDSEPVGSWKADIVFYLGVSLIILGFASWAKKARCLPI